MEQYEVQEHGTLHLSYNPGEPANLAAADHVWQVVAKFPDYSGKNHLNVHGISVVKTRRSLNIGTVNGRFYCISLGCSIAKCTVSFLPTIPKATKIRCENFSFTHLLSFSGQHNSKTIRCM